MQTEAAQTEAAQARAVQAEAVQTGTTRSGAGRLLLVRPPRRDPREAGLPVPPLGLAYVAASARAAGWPVGILDAYAMGWSWRRLAREVARQRPEVLGLSAMTPTADVAARAVAMLRPHVGRIVLGGPHPTTALAAVFDHMPGLDAAVVGEGEQALPELLAWWATGGRGDPPAGVLIPGRPFQHATAPRDIGSLPRPARDLLPNHRYRYLFATRPGFATMVTSRGCPFRCSFCDKSVGGSRWRARAPDEVVDELAELVDRYSTGFVNFYDDNFTLKRSRVAAICEEILRRDLDVEWKCEGRVDSVDVELLRLMRRAGCRTVAYGVESGNADTLRRLRKDVTLAQAEAAFAATKAAGLRSLAYVILGAPGEDAAAVRRTIAFCRQLGADYVQFSSLVAMPGSALLAGALPAAGAGSVVNPLDADLARPTLSDLPPDVLQRLMRRAWTSFYLRPRPILRLACDAVASRSVGEAVRLGRAWGRWALVA